MKKSIIITISFFIFLIVGTFVFYGIKLAMIKKFMKNFKAPPAYVSTTTAKSETWHPILSTVGTLKASNGVEVTAQMSGQINRISFKSGQLVQKGALLVQMNDAVERQALNRDLATLHFNEIDYRRKKTLLAEHAISKNALDAAQATYLQTKALVSSDRAIIERKKILAPFSGKLGIRMVDVGQYINPGDAIVSLQALNPLYVDFSLPEQDLSKIKMGQSVVVAVDAYPGQTFKGHISAISPQISVNTRSIDIRAVVPNQSEQLYPGLFANVTVMLPAQMAVTTIPQSAIDYSLYGDSVYVVRSEKKGQSMKKMDIAVQKYVTLGVRRQDSVAITSGIKPGDIVVTSGQVKLHPNAHIIINNSIQLNKKMAHLS